MNEVIGLCELTGMADLLVGGVFIAPAQVVLDGAGEQDVLLQHHGDIAAEGIQVVFADVDAADLDSAEVNIVQARDELYEARFGGAGAADNADRGTCRNVQVNIGKYGLALCAVTIAELNVLEIDAAVRNALYGIFGGGKSGVSLSSSTTRSPEVRDMVSMTKIIERPMRLMRICVA